MKRTIRRILFLCAAFVLALDILLYLPTLLKSTPQTLPAKDSVHFIDVGQGDCALLLSGGQAVLIDAGTAENGDNIVHYLKSLGIESLFAVVATHPHSDHIGGMAQIIDAFPISHFYLGREIANTSSYGNMLDALERNAVQPTVPQIGDSLLFDSGATLTFLGPDEQIADSNLNNRSLITLFQAGVRRVLLMGDAEAAAERALLARYPQLPCEILKVGHHGADTSTSEAFLHAVQPTTAVISCGANNEYGHPSPQTLQNLSLAGVDDVRITAEDGTIVIPLDQPLS